MLDWQAEAKREEVGEEAMVRSSDEWPKSLSTLRAGERFSIASCMGRRKDQLGPESR